MNKTAKAFSQFVVAVGVTATLSWFTLGCVCANPPGYAPETTAPKAALIPDLKLAPLPPVVEPPNQVCLGAFTTVYRLFPDIADGLRQSAASDKCSEVLAEDVPGFRCLRDSTSPADVARCSPQWADFVQTWDRRQQANASPPTGDKLGRLSTAFQLTTKQLDEITVLSVSSERSPGDVLELAIGMTYLCLANQGHTPQQGTVTPRVSAILTHLLDFSTIAVLRHDAVNLYDVFDLWIGVECSGLRG